MAHYEELQKVESELATGMGLIKCQKCGCMVDALKNLNTTLPTLDSADAIALIPTVRKYLEQMRPVQYACLGCAYCYPAAAQNAFSNAFPEQSLAPALACDFRVGNDWPIVVGEYRVLDPAASVAVSTLASTRLVDELADAKPNRVGIVGKTETENIGIDKIVKNVIANPAIQYLVLAGVESEGHRSGQTLLALAENGVDDKGRIVGAQGKRPVLRNVAAEEIGRFRKQVQVVNLIGCEDVATILARIEELSPKEPEPCG